jgi:apolipoprotein N-acyltransferase
MGLAVGTDGVAAVAEAVEPPRWWRLVLAIVSGLALAAAFPTVDLTPLAWVGLVPLLLAIRTRRPRAAFGLGWLTGLTFWLATCYWIVNTIGHYTSVPVPIAMGVLFIMSSALAVYHGAFAAGVRWMEDRGLPAIWIAPALWVTLEWLRGWFFIGFPWAALGYSQWRFHDLVQMAEVTGVYGVSAVVVFFNVVAAAVLRERGRGVRPSFPALVVVTLLVTLLPFLGRMRAASVAAMPAVGHVRIGLAQGNIAQDRKWDPSFQGETMARYRELTLDAARNGAQLVAWPETAAPFFFQEQGPLRDEMLDIAHEAGVPIIFGSPAFRQTVDGHIQQLNRAYLLMPDGRENGSYDKIELVPFGEYVPFARVLFFVSQMVTTAVGQIGAGVTHTVFDVASDKFGVLVCYEGIFPALTRTFVDGGADFLVNVTNDAWYGQTSAPYQHLVQGTFRAIENRVPMVRAANTGISAVIDADGRIRWQGPLFEELWHVDDVSWTGVRTFYTRFGDVFVYLCALTTVIAIAVGLFRHRV